MEQTLKNKKADASKKEVPAPKRVGKKNQPKKESAKPFPKKNEKEEPKKADNPIVDTETLKKSVETTKEFPTDLRGSKRRGRPSNTEKSSISRLKEDIRIAMADILGSIKKADIKKMNMSDKISFISKMWPIIAEEGDCAEDVTIDMLVQKAARVSLRVADANEISMQTESDDA